MLMSKSRLEKFLYALYSLDSSDLPTPLSRIEELYKCLVTGEEPPTFEPLSRVEKYLMAILGVYNVNELEADEDGVYRIYYRGVYAKEFDDIIEAYFLNKEEQIGNTLQYSVNTYIYKKQEATDEALVSIVKAIYNYGASTKSYDELN